MGLMLEKNNDDTTTTTTNTDTTNTIVIIIIIINSEQQVYGYDVAQVGLPSDKAQYIHRLGRTARAGKGGHGILLLCDFESVRFFFLTSSYPLVLFLGCVFVLVNCSVLFFPVFVVPK